MKRIVGILGALVLGLFLLAPAVTAADPAADRQSVLIAINHDVTVPPGEHVDTLLVVNGTATVAGDVTTVVAIQGTAALATGATAKTVVAIGGDVTLAAGTVVSGDVRTIDATVEQATTAVVQGTVGDMSAELVGMGLFLGPAIVLFAIGFLLAAIVAGLFLAAVGARQVRSAEGLISTEPGPVLVAGLAGIMVTPIVAILAIVTIIGAPLGLGILFGLWPLMAFLGYLLAGIWIGEWVLRRTSPDRPRERPYLAAVVGLVLLQLISFIPFAAAIASLFGFGAVILLTWRTFRHHELGPETTARPAPVPAGA